MTTLTTNSKEVIFLLGPSKKKFPVLRGLLLLASPVFRELSSEKTSSSSSSNITINNNNNNNNIVLSNVDTESFQVVVDYISGKEEDAKSQISEKNICDILFVAQEFQISELLRIASQRFLSIISIDNFMNFYHYASSINNKHIEIILWWWLLKKSGDICQKLAINIFLECNEKQLSYLLQQNYCGLNEEDLFKGVLQWLKRQYNTNSDQRSPREILTNIYPYIRFPLMKNEFLANEVYNSGILTSQELLNVYRAKTLKNFSLTPFSNEKRVIHLPFSKTTSDEEEIKEGVFNPQAKEIFSVVCVGDSGTWNGWPTSSMLTDDSNYWCTAALQYGADVWCIFDLGDQIASQMMLKFSSNGPASLVKVFTGDTMNRDGQWEKLAEKTYVAPNNIEIVFDTDTHRYIMLKFENWQAGFVGVERVKFYSKE